MYDNEEENVKFPHPEEVLLALGENLEKYKNGPAQYITKEHYEKRNKKYIVDCLMRKGIVEIKLGCRDDVYLMFVAKELKDMGYFIHFGGENTMTISVI